ncbi:hypothetical protein GQ54DRAFT_304252 [Martensiomyces pterosporus]|nr:hypothetical protein GQ54DRAFT_304252 [Martensiomyces pterosporus]
MHSTLSASLFGSGEIEYSPFSSVAGSLEAANETCSHFGGGYIFCKQSVPKSHQHLELRAPSDGHIGSFSLAEVPLAGHLSAHAQLSSVGGRAKERWAYMRRSLDYRPSAHDATFAAAGSYSEGLEERAEDGESTKSNNCESTLAGSSGSGSLEHSHSGLCSFIHADKASASPWYDREELEESPTDYPDMSKKLAYSHLRRTGKRWELGRALKITTGGLSVLSRRHQGCRDWSDSLKFALKQHSLYPGVLEVIDCEDMGVAYRRISRSKMAWCETFHEVEAGISADSMEIADFCDSFSPAYSSSIIDQLSGSMSPSFSESMVSVDTFGSYMTTTPPMAPYGSIPSSVGRSYVPTVSSVHGCPQRLYGRQESHPYSYNMNQLWEISSPCPNSFPLHCRDSRGVIDPVPLSSMVLDRHQFCYRFQLAGNKMMWVAKNPSYEQVELHCHVRSTLVAVLLGNGYSSAWDMQRHGGLGARRQLRRSDKVPSLTIAMMPPQGSSPMAATAAGSETSESAGLCSSHCLPRIIIFPLAFSKLASVDPDIVESFVIFTGIAVLECLYAL